MSITRFLAAALLAVLPLAPGSAFAAALTVSLTGSFDGSLAGRSFSGSALTFTGTADSDVADDVFGESHYALDTLTVTMNGMDYTITEPVMFFIAPDSTLAGFADPDAARSLVSFDYAAANAFYGAFAGAFSSSGGALAITGARSLALSGVDLPGAAAVPEPASWALMLAGFAIVGGTLRRRRTVVAYA